MSPNHMTGLSNVDRRMHKSEKQFDTRTHTILHEGSHGGRLGGKRAVCTTSDTAVFGNYELDMPVSRCLCQRSIGFYAIG